MTNVLLGYCDEVAQESPIESYLQSRCGGVPGWLRPEGLEDVEKFICDHCRLPLIFLLQVYCPREGERTFHRMLYVFSCWHCGKTVRCLRQIASCDYGLLPESPQDPNGEGLLEKLQAQLTEQASLCELCKIPCSAASVDGVRYHKHCSNYILKHTDQSPVRKRYDLGISTEAWEDYSSEVELGEGEEVEAAASTTLPVGESDEVVTSKILDSSATHDPNDDLQLDSSLPDTLPQPSRTLAAARELNPTNEDPVLDRYIEVMNKFPGHVLAYGGPEPIWFCSIDRLKDDNVPGLSCECCGKKRRFEFQIQSSLVDKLHLTSDLEFGFGILAVYTCSDDCQNSAQEFIYKQRDPTIQVHIRLEEDQ